MTSTIGELVCGHCRQLTRACQCPNSPAETGWFGDGTDGFRGHNQPCKSGVTGCTEMFHPPYCRCYPQGTK